MRHRVFLDKKELFRYGIAPNAFLFIHLGHNQCRNVPGPRKRAKNKQGNYVNIDHLGLCIGLKAGSGLSLNINRPS